MNSFCFSLLEYPMYNVEMNSFHFSLLEYPKEKCRLEIISFFHCYNQNTVQTTVGECKDPMGKVMEWLQGFYQSRHRENQPRHKIIHMQRLLPDGGINNQPGTNIKGSRLTGSSFAHHPHTDKHGVEIHRSFNAKATTVDQDLGRLLRRGMVS